MNVLAAIKREERKLEKQLSKLNSQLSGVRAAAKQWAALRSANRRREKARLTVVAQEHSRAERKKTMSPPIASAAKLGVVDPGTASPPCRKHSRSIR
jgi:hypothetical protein